METSLVTERLLATLSTVFGALATLLAAVGLYGVMAFMVTRRTREIGIRMALGASSGSVVWLIMREVLILAVTGLAIGLAAAVGLTRLVEAQLFGIQSHRHRDHPRHRRRSHAGRVPASPPRDSG